MGISTIRSKLKRGLALTQKESGDLWEYIRSLEKPQPKTGHWIDIETLDSALWHECSECGETEFYATNYCPNCGADMRESEG